MPVKPDVVFVHWVSDFANAKFLAELKQLTGAEIVFILVDHALYSGGCHYQIDCQGYKDRCHNCPATTSRIVKRGIEKNYAFKKKYLPHGTIIVPTKEDSMRLSQSAIYKDFRFEKLVFPIDANKFCPAADRMALRRQWNLPIDKKMVFFGATSLNERRKGIKELLEALPFVQAKDVVYVAAGKTKGLQLPENTITVGYLNEAQLIQMYQMADVFVCASLADAGPMMVNQALLCGCPVVAFPVGVSVELVRTGKTGYQAKYGDSADLAKGIDAILSLPQNEWKEMSANCRKLGVDTYANPNEKNTINALISKIGK
jgi:glycosyltransferase involved in cell wall biosynthesis